MKYTDDLPDDSELTLEELNAHAGYHNIAHSRDEKSSGNPSDDADARNLLESKVRGRHQCTAASLRIKQIEQVLKKTNDLTKHQRRKLQSRKNTANFRERQQNSQKLKDFINVELDAIISQVRLSVSNSCHFSHFFNRVVVMMVPILF